MCSCRHFKNCLGTRLHAPKHPAVTRNTREQQHAGVDGVAYRLVSRRVRPGRCLQEPSGMGRLRQLR